MPTEVTVAPFRYQQQYPVGLEHPRTFSSVYTQPRTLPALAPLNTLGISMGTGMGTGMGGLHPHPQLTIPPTGPAPVGELVQPRAGQVLPNGVRNPWAPYAGETYAPASEAAHMMQANQLQLGHGHAGPGSIGGAASLMTGGLGGTRTDDGWGGSMQRQHNSHAPDMTSTAGAIPHLQTSGNWLNSPSSWANHARMTPSIAGSAHLQLAPPPPPQAHHPPPHLHIATGQLAPHVADSGAHQQIIRPRRMSLTPTVRHETLMANKAPSSTPGRHRSLSVAESPVYRRLSVGSAGSGSGSNRAQHPTAYGGEGGLQRGGSRKSAGPRKRTCSACSAPVF